jgi:DNA-directed RNA polymerase subunit RPC12/RpoP
MRLLVMDLDLGVDEPMVSYAYRSDLASLTEPRVSFGAGYRRFMAAAEHEELDVVCAHCRKPFRSEILAPNTEQAGFKCPHCRLYMPLERAETGNAGPITTPADATA